LRDRDSREYATGETKVSLAAFLFSIPSMLDNTPGKYFSKVIASELRLSRFDVLN
jgi:hypothetical protein